MDGDVLMLVSSVSAVHHTLYHSNIKPRTFATYVSAILLVRLNGKLLNLFSGFFFPSSNFLALFLLLALVGLCRPHRRQPSSHWQVRLPAHLGKAIKHNARAKQQAVCRATNTERTHLITLCKPLAPLDRNRHCAHFIHANSHKRHEPDGRIVRLDHNDGAGR